MFIVQPSNLKALSAVVAIWLCRPGIDEDFVCVCTHEPAREPEPHTTTKFNCNDDSLGSIVHQYEGFRPGWCILTIYHCRDTPFWLETLEYIHLT